jgi:micrococcal nuclease
MKRLVAIVFLIITVGVTVLLFPMSDDTERKAPSPALSAPKVENQTIVCKGTARCFAATVKRVVDGDTLDIGDFRIRLALVNTPERGELGYSEATRFTASVCPVGTGALVDEDDEQREGSFERMVALVYCNGKNLNAELLDKGHASILTRFCSMSEFASESWAKGCR